MRTAFGSKSNVICCYLYRQLNSRLCFRLRCVVRRIVANDGYAQLLRDCVHRVRPFAVRRHERIGVDARDLRDYCGPAGGVFQVALVECDRRFYHSQPPGLPQVIAFAGQSRLNS